MFGYITLDKLNMYFKDHALYRAFYCGNCLITKKRFGNLARLTTNYDMTFVQVLLHSYLGVQPEYAQKRCLFNPRKKLTVTINPLMERLVDLNILFAYYKLLDDALDAKKRLGKRLFYRTYKRARKNLPDCDEIIAKYYAELRELEQQNVKSIDRVAHPFSEMLKGCAKSITGEKYKEELGGLCYNIGKYIYLMDALDDIDEDFKSKNYNPFLASFPDFKARTDFFKTNAKDISFVMNATINSCIQCYTDLGLKEGKDLLDNIILRALRRRFKQLIESNKKLKNEKL